MTFAAVASLHPLNVCLPNFGVFLLGKERTCTKEGPWQPRWERIISQLTINHRPICHKRLVFSSFLSLPNKRNFENISKVEETRLLWAVASQRERACTGGARAARMHPLGDPESGEKQFRATLFAFRMTGEKREGERE